MEIREKSVMARLTFYLDSFSSMFAFYRGSAMLGTSPKISNKSFNKKYLQDWRTERLDGFRQRKSFGSRARGKLPGETVRWKFCFLI